MRPIGRRELLAGAVAAGIVVLSTQIQFGTDFPLGNGSAAVVATGLRDNTGFTAAELRAIERDNALVLLRRLSA
jgi:hypothetical protein